MGKKKRKKATGSNQQPDKNLPSERKSKDRPIFLSIIGIVILVIAAVIWLSQDSSSQEGQGGPSIYFPEDSYDFGTISQKTQVSHTFIVKNTGGAPLKLIKAKGS
jgi:hypothetical protein